MIRFRLWTPHRGRRNAAGGTLPGRSSWLMVAAVLVLGSAGGGAYAAFHANTQNGADSFTAGSVAISDDDSDNALMSVSSMRPGDIASGCIQVSYSGSLSSTVRLYASSSGALASYLTLKITRGSGTGNAPSCGGFTADTADYIGQGNGVIYSGSLSSFPASWNSGLVDPLTASPETWTNGETHRYKLEVGLNNDANAQAKSGSASFIWEARNQ